MAILSDTKKYLNKLALSLALMLASVAGYAQAVSVSTLVLPPYSPKLSDYSEADANRVIITLTNNTQRPQSIKLHLKFTGDNGVRVTTKAAYEPATPIVLNPLEVKRLSGVDDFSFLEIDNFEITGFDAAQIAQTSIIPEGNYTICAVAYQALTPGTSVPLSDINGGCSAPIPIAYVEAPLLIGVSGQPCGSTIPYEPNNLLTFTWNPSAGARAGAKYRFTMFELLPANRVANDAIFSDPNPIVDKEVDAPFIAFSPQQTGLLPGVRYVYRVQVIDPTEQTVFKNQGYSQICTFGLAADQAAAVNNANSNYTGEIVYPAENDTIPFQKLWIVSKLNPGVRNVSQGDAQVSLRQNQFALEEIRNSYRNINNNGDQSSFAHHPNASLSNNLHGREINAAVNFNLNIAGNAVQQEISLNQSFTYGMGKPAVLNASANADSALVFNLRILPSAAPSSILPKGIQTLIRDQNNPAERWSVNEKMFVEVSSNQNFSNPVRVKFIPFSLSFDPANITEEEIRRNLYAAKNISIRLPNANATYVRVGWLSNASDSTAVAYHYSSAVNLAGQIAQAPPRTGVRVGGRIRIAGFDLVIAELTTPQAPFTGVGKITIPFLNQTIKINFSGITVDSLGNVTGGFARAFNTFNDALNQLNKEASKALMLVEAKKREMLDLVRRNLPDSNGLSLPYTFTWGDGNLVTIYKLDFNRDSASVHAYSEIQLPFDEGEEPLKIGLFNAKFKPNCVGADQLRFDVLSNHSFALGGGNFLNVAPRGGRNSFVNFNCNGFQGAQLIGSVRISPQYIKTQQGNDTVDVNTEITLDEHYESITNIAVPAFVVNKLNDWNFSNSNWILDLSSSANGAGMPGTVNGRRIGVDWKGLYVAGLTVTTPRWVAGQNNVRPVVNARQLLIDETGFTGKIGATNLIPNDGSRNWSGWNYSIDSVGIDFRSNAVQRSTIRGRIKTPLHRNNASASFDLGVVLPEQGNATYTGQFTLGRDIEFSALYAQVDITETVAHISIGNDVNFDLQLTGSMTANVPLPGGGNEAANARIRFRDMSIRNIGNTFELRNVEFEDVRVMGYELGAEEVELTSATDRNNPQLKVYSIRIGGCLASEAVSFANMQSALRLNFEYDNNRKRFTPRSPDLDNASVSGEFGPLSLSGSLAFYNNNQTWGNGLEGRVNCSMDFGTSDGVQITSNFRLGKKNTTVYWYIDGSVGRLNIPLFPGVMNLDGFGIGVYSNLSPVKSNTPGSYYTYTVTPNRFGFTASVSMASVTPGAYKLKGEINTTFNTRNFSVSNVRLGGKLALMGSNYPGEGNGDFKFSADVELNMDLENGAFQGNASAYLKVGPLIRGSGNGDRFGTIDVSVRRGGYWHVHVGRPQDNDYAGMNIGVGALALEFRTYFMIGKDIPPMQYPQALIDIIGVEHLPTPRAAPEITQGFAHGASLSFDSGKKTFLIFYGRFQFTVGYDFNVLKYENASCDGINTRTIGIDNWYAQGQVYAGARGSIGLHVDVWFYEGNIEIASIGGAVLLEVGLPNPTWMAGTFAGRYRVLGGAIKGSFNFKFSVGDVCRPTVEMESPVANLELIEAIDPDNPRAGQKPDVVPEVAMRFVRANAFTIAVPDAQGSGSVIRTFRANWDINFSNVAQNGQKIPVAYRQDVNVSEDSFSYIKLIPNGFLPFDKSYEVSVTARMEERINGRWVTARRKDNSLITQTKTVRFRTTPTPTIEQYFIANQYPEPNRSYMYNYNSNGRMVFVDNPSGLFMPTASKMKSQLSGQVFDFGMEKNVKYLMRYTDLETDQQAYVPLNIPPRTRRVDFNLRPLGFGKTYKIEIIRVLSENTFLRDYESSMDRPVFHAATLITAAANASIGSQVPSGIRQNALVETSFDNNGNTIEVVKHRRQSNMSLEEFLSAILIGMVNSFEDVMYETYVMTSKYQSLREKFQRTNFGFLVLGNSINLLGTGDEGLSVEDMDGRLAWHQEGLGGHPIWAIPTENNAWFVKAKQFYEALTVLFNENMLLQQDIQQYGQFSTNPLYSSAPAPRGSYVFTPGDLHIKLFPINNNSTIGYNNDVRSWMGSRNLYTSMALSGNKFQQAPHQVLKRDWERARNWISVMASSNRIPQNASNNARSKAIWILFNEAPDLQEGGGSNNWRLSVYPKERVMRDLFPEIPPIGNFNLAPSIR